MILYLQIDVDIFESDQMVFTENHLLMGEPFHPQRCYDHSNYGHMKQDSSTLIVPIKSLSKLHKSVDHELGLIFSHVPGFRGNRQCFFCSPEGGITTPRVLVGEEVD